MPDLLDEQLASCRRPVLEFLDQGKCPHCGHDLHGATVARRDAINRVATEAPLEITHTMVSLTIRYLVDEGLINTDGRGGIRLSAKGKRELTKMRKGAA